MPQLRLMTVLNRLKKILEKIKKRNKKKMN
jgi:hypothetical protein